MMNEIMAWFRGIDPEWNYELYHTVNARPGHDLTDEDLDILSQFKNKGALREATWNMPGAGPYDIKIITLKDAANWLRVQEKVK